VSSWLIPQVWIRSRAKEMPTSKRLKLKEDSNLSFSLADGNNYVFSLKDKEYYYNE
jgi:hypothetical protein